MYAILLWSRRSFNIGVVVQYVNYNHLDALASYNSFHPWFSRPCNIIPGFKTITAARKWNEDNCLCEYLYDHPKDGKEIREREL